MKFKVNAEAFGMQLAQKAMSVVDLAEKMNISRVHAATLAQKINRGQPVTTKVAGNIAKAIGIDAKDLGTIILNG